MLHGCHYVYRFYKRNCFSPMNVMAMSMTSYCFSKRSVSNPHFPTVHCFSFCA